jgi:hypothetical protein
MASSNWKTAVTASGRLARNVAIMVSAMPEALLLWVVVRCQCLEDGGD